MPSKKSATKHDLNRELKGKLQGADFKIDGDNTPQFFIFISFDLVNSTQLKTSHEAAWQQIVFRFFELIESSILTRLDYCVPWKRLGDEALFYISISNSQQFADCLPTIQSIMEATTDKLHQEHPASRSLTSVKAAVWMAEAIESTPGAISNSTLPFVGNNLVMPVRQYGTDGGDLSVKDFVGPDIDIGFRASKYTRKSRIVVSANLAYILFNLNVGFAKKHLRIVSLEMLKGVWSGRPYPIVWFETDWADFGSSLEYDEFIESDILRRISEAGELEKARYQIDQIISIFENLGLKEKAQEMLANLDNLAATTQPSAPIIIPDSKKAEVHCVAICFNSKGDVLVAQRPANKKRLPNCWEFGCGQLRVNETFADCANSNF